MTISGKTKFIGLLVFLLLQTAVLLFFGFVFLRERGRTAILDRAFREYEQGNWEKARQELLQAVRQDPVNERVHVCLAEIAEREQNWPQASDYWFRAFHLNQLKAEYRRKACLALASGREFAELAAQFMPVVQAGKPLDEEESFFYLFALYQLDRRTEAVHYLRQLQKENPDFFHTDFGRLIQLRNSEKIEERDVRNLTVSKHPLVAYEALGLLAGLHSARQEERKLEETLLKMSEINRFGGLPLLGNYYMQTGRFEQAAEIFLKDWKAYRRPIAAILAGENWLLNGQLDRLDGFLARYSQDDKGGIISGYYLKSLLAFGRGDQKALIENWPHTDKKFQTPLSRLIALYTAVALDQPPLVENEWNHLIREPGFYDFRKRAEKILTGYIRILISANRLEEAVRLLGMNQMDRYSEILFARCFAAGRLSQGTLTEPELRAALERHPDDAVLLQIAAEYYFKCNQFPQAKHYVEQAAKQSLPENSGIPRLQIRLLVQEGKINEAAALFLEQSVRRPKDAALTAAFCQFCVQYRREEELQQLVRRMDGSPLHRYVRGELDWLQGRKDEALKAFAQLESDQPDILFRTAYLLGIHDVRDAAIRNYEKLLQLNPPGWKPVILANLSELHLGKNEKAKALQYARECWQLDPRNRNAILCYAGKLLAVGEVEKIFELVPVQLAVQSPELKEIWRQAMETFIGTAYGQEQFGTVRKLAEELRKHFPGNTVAADYLRRLAARNGKNTP